MQTLRCNYERETCSKITASITICRCWPFAGAAWAISSLCSTHLWRQVQSCGFTTRWGARDLAVCQLQGLDQNIPCEPPSSTALMQHCKQWASSLMLGTKLQRLINCLQVPIEERQRLLLKAGLDPAELTNLTLVYQDPLTQVCSADCLHECSAGCLHEEAPLERIACTWDATTSRLCSRMRTSADSVHTLRPSHVSVRHIKGAAELALDSMSR